MIWLPLFCVFWFFAWTKNFSTRPRQIAAAIGLGIASYAIMGILSRPELFQ